MCNGLRKEKTERAASASDEQRLGARNEPEGENAAPPVVILANGEFPQSAAAQRFIVDAPSLVCCDGAAEKAVAFGREPDWIVGDLDSVPEALKTRFRDRLVRVAEQETNDLDKAFRFCVERGWTELAILGATGLRADHALGNISRLVDFARVAPSIRLIDDFGVFRVALKSGTFASRPGEQISIFSFNPTQAITSQGLKYPLNRLKLPRWSTATLNEALGESFSLEFDAASPLLLFFANELKIRK